MAKGKISSKCQVGVLMLMMLLTVFLGRVSAVEPVETNPILDLFQSIPDKLSDYGGRINLPYYDLPRWDQWIGSKQINGKGSGAVWDGDDKIYAIASADLDDDGYNEVYVGGDFEILDVQGGGSIYNIAKWNGVNWECIDPNGYLSDNTVYALEVDTVQNKVYFGSGDPVNPFGFYDGSSLIELNFVFGNAFPLESEIAVFSLYFEESTEILYVGGRFDTIDSVQMNNIGRYNTNTSSFSPVADNNIPGVEVNPYGSVGVGNDRGWYEPDEAPAYVFAINKYEGDIYIGGIFRYDTQLHYWHGYIAVIETSNGLLYRVLDGLAWGNHHEQEAVVRALEVYEDVLYIGGLFRYAHYSQTNFISVNHIVNYDLSSWFDLTGGVQLTHMWGNTFDDTMNNMPVQAFEVFDMGYGGGTGSVIIIGGHYYRTSVGYDLGFYGSYYGWNPVLGGLKFGEIEGYFVRALKNVPDSNLAGVYDDLFIGGSFQDGVLPDPYDDFYNNVNDPIKVFCIVRLAVDDYIVASKDTMQNWHDSVNVLLKFDPTKLNYPAGNPGPIYAIAGGISGYYPGLTVPNFPRVVPLVVGGDPLFGVIWNLPNIFVDFVGYLDPPTGRGIAKIDFTVQKVGYNGPLYMVAIGQTDANAVLMFPEVTNTLSIDIIPYQ